VLEKWERLWLIVAGRLADKMVAGNNPESGVCSSQQTVTLSASVSPLLEPDFELACQGG